jgi:prepilin-type N-terminal cleavage/methylation domain-containing protein
MQGRHFLRRRGLTLIEALICLVIVSVVMAIASPLIIRAKNAARVTVTVQRLRQCYTAVMLYRLDWEDESYGTASEMGLPSLIYVASTNLGLPRETWNSGCRSRSTPDYRFDFMYNASDSAQYAADALRFESNLILIADISCSDPDVPIYSEYIPIRGLGVLLGGSLVNKRKVGRWTQPEWWADPIY